MITFVVVSIKYKVQSCQSIKNFLYKFFVIFCFQINRRVTTCCRISERSENIKSLFNAASGRVLLSVLLKFLCLSKKIVDFFNSFLMITISLDIFCFRVN